jgi:hypothetical protein
MELISSAFSSTVLYFTQEDYDAYAVGNYVALNSKMILVLSREMRKDLGDYFEITYRIVG